MLDGERYLALTWRGERGAMLGTLDCGRLQLEEIHRFHNDPVQWAIACIGILRLWAEVKRGLGHAAARAGRHLAGVGVDTWALTSDFSIAARSDRPPASLPRQPTEGSWRI